MPGIKQAQKEKIERVKSIIQRDSRLLFNGALEKGFLYFGAQLCLNQADSIPTQDDLLENFTDGKDDLEIDAYHIDDDGRAIYLFQSKFRSDPTTIPSKDLSNFLDAPLRLTNPQALLKNTNEKILDLAPVFREKILDGFEVNLSLLSTGRATPQIMASANKWNDESLALYVGGDRIDAPHNIAINDIDAILNQFDSAVDQTMLMVDLALRQDEWHLAPAGGFDCIVATLEAEELARVFNNYKYKIFQSNPRGPLSSAKVNKDISATLRDDEKRKLFHLLNNGLSAVCDSFTEPQLSDGKQYTRVNDLQIVNGCQTTYNVWDYWRRGGSLENSHVQIKIVAAPTLKRDISKTSNQQNQMKDWDFLFNDPVQQMLQREFLKLEPPVFYEIKRGEYTYMVQTDAERVTTKDAAQATWAFLGNPGQAKDKLRDIPRSIENMNGAYKEVFFDGVSASYIWLPWLTYKKVQAEYQAYSNATGISGDFREYGRLHVLWLVGRGLTKSLGKKSYKEIDSMTAGKLAKEIESWFPELHKIAVEAVKYIVRVKEDAAKENKQTLQLRQLFRSGADYARFEEAFDERIEESDIVKTIKGIL